MDRLILPDAPADQAGAVKAWSQPVVLPTYAPMPPDRNPMFLEKRVYQGSSGRVYPLPFVDRISHEKTEQTWEAVHLENELIRLMILPQIGGRIHVGMDKTDGYDFFYRQNVIKPALVGLAGPWISGGVEFNWPQHHRPSTFMPVDVHIEEHADGSKTVWLSEHEPMNRMKGMHGVCLHPGRGVIELKVRLYNRTELVQTFLWWANVAVRVHDRYQSFFPPDVRYVADHAKRAMSRFPRCDGRYYGVNYGDRTGMTPQGYPANDLSWYANIPVPTSYMAMGSGEDFFGGYDHAREAGFVHVANHHIAPGKKQWTWGNHAFGHAWDRNLTDDDGPYIELMAGVYTDNQPDFSFLHPGETRTFSQFWYPIQKIGPANKANLDAAVTLGVKDGKVMVGVAVTQVMQGVRVKMMGRGQVVGERVVDLAMDRPLCWEVKLPAGCVESDLSVSVMAGDGRMVIEYSPRPAEDVDLPQPATEPALPETIASNDALYLTGLHLEQYRHATRSPEPYWREALKRDPGDVRCNNALGLWHLRRGEFEQAGAHFRAAVARLTRRNPNPYDGEPFYNLGLALRHMGRGKDAYTAFYKATWDYAWQSAAFFALAELDCREKRWEAALEHLDRTLRVNVEHLSARNLKSVVLRRLGRDAEAEVLLRQTLELDPLDFQARHLTGQRLTCDAQVRIDLALDYARAGLVDEALDVLAEAESAEGIGVRPIIHYHRAYIHARNGNDPAAQEEWRTAAQASSDYCFPARLEEIAVLQAAIEARPEDARARYYLGNLYYDRRRHDDAIALWEAAARIDPAFAIVWRNLGIAYFNVCREGEKARQAYERAVQADPDDARLIYERDQLWKRLGESPHRRLAELEKRPEQVRQRDDLSLEWCALLNLAGRHEEAQQLLAGRVFQPWEGGEGVALGQHVRTHLALGRRALDKGDPSTALRMFEAALSCPSNLGESRHLLANQSDVQYWLGMAHDALGDAESAQRHWTSAAQSQGDFQQMSVRPCSEMTWFSALAWGRLGRAAEADQLLERLSNYATALLDEPATIDYFATSLPTLLLFDDDLQKRQAAHARLMLAQVSAARGDAEGARQLLGQVLAIDPSDATAAELLASIQ